MPVTNSIFRRGGPKAELFVNLADDSTDYTQDTQAKLQGLLAIWKQPRLGCAYACLESTLCCPRCTSALGNAFQPDGCTGRSSLPAQ
jgi:hypothetical protein